jgi:para-nitrobenzyl esterase
MIKIDAIAKTKAGKLQGVQINGIYRFLGVRYAESTEGKNRFLPPQPLISWQGVKPALTYAGKSWQCDTPRMEDPEIRNTRYPSAYEKLMTGSNEMGAGFQSEDCCALNLWTQGLNDGKKRPVLVWFHGGGNIAGAAEADWHDGYNIAKKEDVILISVGHRLGIFGYLYLCDLDEKYKDSANVGHQDMAAALKWIHENIEEFGGDPENVTLFGQSGGGGKVAALMSMPLCRGMVHKAIIQSGGFHAGNAAEATAFTLQLLDFLGIEKNHLEKLYNYSAAELIQAQRDINKTRTVDTYFVCPLVQDGRVIKYDPFDGAEGSEYVKNIPLITGYDKDDAVLSALFNPKAFTWNMTELREAMKGLRYTAAQTDKIIATYKSLLGDDVRPVHIYTTLMNDRNHNKASYIRAMSRAKVGGGAPVYNYCFMREGNDPDFRAVHGVEIPFFFGNAAYAPALWTCENYEDAMILNAAASAAWGSFARTGNPSNAGMPVWRPYEEETRYTMCIDVESQLVSRFHKETYEFVY